MTTLLNNVCSIRIQYYVDYFVAIIFWKHYNTIYYVGIIYLMAIMLKVMLAKFTGAFDKTDFIIFHIN